MNWHTRYVQQASWTRQLRSYIFDKASLKNARHVLEVGCGTGAILSEIGDGPTVYGLDIDHPALVECGLHAPHAVQVQGNVLDLPFRDRSFDIVYSHFLLLLVKHPLLALQEMKSVIRPEGTVIAFAEPNYLERADKPSELVQLGRWQTESLIRQGADPGLGARLAELFFEAGIKILETGTIESPKNEPSLEEWEIEWQVIESDLEGWVPELHLQRMKRLDKQARESGERVLHVPTYFAWGSI